MEAAMTEEQERADVLDWLAQADGAEELRGAA